MKKSWLLQLLISLLISSLYFGSADAVVMENITACIDCHSTNPQTNASPVEGAARVDGTTGSIIGSHSYHINSQSLTCAGCHGTLPTALDHRDGKIQMASPMSGGVTYSAAVGGVVTQDNQLNTTGMGTCSGGTGGCHSSASPVWGTPSTCQTCHGYPPVTTTSDVDNKHVSGATPVNHIGTGATVNTKATFVSQHGGCQVCHGTESTTDGTGNTHAPHANYVVSTQHATGSINVNGPTSAATTASTRYDAATGGCNAACHANDASHRMTTSGKTLAYGLYGGGYDCIGCHTTAQTSPVAQGLNAAVTSRVAIVPDFSLASKHTRSRGTAVTNNDCCVCHMEGDVATGSPTSFHKNGYIELRDPDLGTTIKGVSHSGTTTAAGVYTSTATDARPVRFSRNLGSATIEPDTAAIMVNLCLKCHDADGALSATAIVAGGIALKPFAGTVTANPGGGVLNVAGQFASSNRSFHPVLVRQNSGYTNTGGSRMVAPWNAVTKTGTTLTYGPLITCWDCHAPNNTASTVTLTTSGIHGGAVSGTDPVPLRGNVYNNSATATTLTTNLCAACHVTTGNTSNHGTGSAITSSTNGSMTYFSNRCYYCHSGVESTARAARPIGAGDAHGYNTRANGTAFAAGNLGYAFIRRTGLPQVVKTVGATTVTASCSNGGANATGICSQGMGNYAPGGVY